MKRVKKAQIVARRETMKRKRMRSGAVAGE